MWLMLCKTSLADCQLSDHIILLPGLQRAMKRWLIPRAVAKTTEAAAATDDNEHALAEREAAAKLRAVLLPAIASAGERSLTERTAAKILFADRPVTAAVRPVCSRPLTGRSCAGSSSLPLMLFHPQGKLAQGVGNSQRMQAPDMQ